MRQQDNPAGENFHSALVQTAKTLGRSSPPLWATLTRLFTRVHGTVLEVQLWLGPGAPSFFVILTMVDRSGRNPGDSAYLTGYLSPPSNEQGKIAFSFKPNV